MSERNEIIEQYHTRLSLFRDGYEWEETDGILRAFGLVGNMLSVAFDPVTAARGMQAMRLVVNTHPEMPINWATLPEETLLDWEETWGDLDGFNDSYWPALMEKAHDLNAFAYFGILTTWDLEDADRAGPEFNDVPSVVRTAGSELTRFLQLLPVSLKLHGIEMIEQTCLAATARLKIDLGEPLSVHELAAVTRVSTKRLQNAIYAKTADSPIVNKNDGLIPVATAQRWLDARDYLPSIWKQFVDQEGWELEGFTPSVADDEEEDREDFLFVPVARDGTLFSPNLCGRKGAGGQPSYTIGAKGNEKTYDDYEKAIVALAEMSIPRWRRPNENGNFGIVSAEQWRRLS